MEDEPYPGEEATSEAGGATSPPACATDDLLSRLQAEFLGTPMGLALAGESSILQAFIDYGRERLGKLDVTGLAVRADHVALNTAEGHIPLGPRVAQPEARQTRKAAPPPAKPAQRNYISTVRKSRDTSRFRDIA